MCNIVFHDAALAAAKGGAAYGQRVVTQQAILPTAITFAGPANPQDVHLN